MKTTHNPSQWVTYVSTLVRQYKATSLSISLLLIFMLFSSSRLGGASANNHFAYLAEAFLSGQLHLKTRPPHGNDWASYEVIELSEASKARVESVLERPVERLRGVYLPQGAFNKGKRLNARYRFETLKGERFILKPHEIKSRQRKYFVSFPPFPALLITPLVAIFGLAASDVWLTIFFAALNGALAYHLCLQVIQSRRRGWIKTDNNETDDVLLHQEQREALWLAVSLSLGTAHFWCAVRGEVWFTALIIGVSCQLLFFRWAWGLRRPILAGLAYACAFSTRASLITLALFVYLQVFTDKLSLRERLYKLTLFSLPPLAIGLVLLYYNHLRFDRIYEFGHRYLAGGQLSRIAQYGLFNMIFLKKNLIAAFALLPLFSFSAPLITYSWHGMSLPFSSPHLMLSLLGQRRSSKILTNTEQGGIRRTEQVHVWGLLLVLVSTFSLLMLYQNTGWVQYSWRFALDVIPALTLIIALAGHAQRMIFKLLCVWGIMINMIGALIFGRSSLWWDALNLPNLLPH